MASKRRRARPPLIKELEANPSAFDFFEAVRIAELNRGVGVDPETEAEPVGEGDDPTKEAVRFSSDPSLMFPPGEIKSYAPDRKEPDQMEIRFMGLTGAMGPLPRPINERLLSRRGQGDTAWRAFLDIFNHRLASIMVRVRKAHRVGLDPRPPADTGMARMLRAFLGLGTPHTRQRVLNPDTALLRYAGLFAHRSRSAAGLERLLSDYFGVPVSVRPCVGEWVDLEEGQETVLSCNPLGSKARNHGLGTGAFLGRRYWDQQSSFELLIGPLDREMFESFLRGGSRYKPLRSLVTFYTSPEFNVTARLIAAPEAVPKAILGQKGALRLGWTSWLRQEGAAQQDSQVKIRVRHHTDWQKRLAEAKNAA